VPTTDDSSPPPHAPVIHQVYKDTAETLNAKAVKEYEEAGGDAAHADADADDDEKGAEELGLPLARVKRIMKLDKEVKNMQVDASKCVAKCAELFIESLVEGSFHGMKANKRKTIKYNDVEHHVLR
jgi:histone H3/H4